MDIAHKAEFLRTGMVPKISSIDPATASAWGKMNVHQMVEHMSMAIRQATGKIPVAAALTPEENIPRMQAFIQSDKQFKENTANALLPEDPIPTKYATMQESVAELKSDVNDFFAHYEKTPSARVLNPFFGSLDYELQVQLLYKHAQHHLRQFGVTV